MSESFDEFADKLPSVQDALKVLNHDCLSHRIAEELAFRWVPTMLEERQRHEQEHAALTDMHERLVHEHDELTQTYELVSEEYDALLQQFIKTSRNGPLPDQ